jgi:hypothetical protein
MGSVCLLKFIASGRARRGQGLWARQACCHLH